MLKCRPLSACLLPSTWAHDWLCTIPVSLAPTPLKVGQLPPTHARFPGSQAGPLGPSAPEGWEFNSLPRWLAGSHVAEGWQPSLTMGEFKGAGL